MNRRTKRIIIGTAAAMTVIQAGICGFFFHTAIKRKTKKREPDPMKMPQKWREIQDQIKERTKWLQEQDTEKVTIRAFDDLLLNSTFFPAAPNAEEPDFSAHGKAKIILAVHGYTSNGIKEYCTIAPFFHEMGYNILLVDDRAHGESEGKYVGYGWNDHKDCMSWIQYLVERFEGNCSIVLYGVSMGAATVMITAGEVLPEQVKGIIEDCGYTTVWKEFTHVIKQDYHIPAFPTVSLTNILNKKIAKYDFKDCSALEAVRKTVLPILFIHGAEDSFVPTKMALELYNTCNSEKELLIVDGAGHAQSYATEPKKYEEKIKAFLDKYIGEDKARGDGDVCQETVG